MTIHVKRIYEPFAPSDGYRILVDRLWPRGIKKETAHIDSWLKDLAPSAALRKWFDHEPEKWASFLEQYRAELEASVAMEVWAGLVKAHARITLLYAARDTQYNNAAALKQLMEA